VSVFAPGQAALAKVLTQQSMQPCSPRPGHSNTHSTAPDTVHGQVTTHSNCHLRMHVLQRSWSGSRCSKVRYLQSCTSFVVGCFVQVVLVPTWSCSQMHPPRCCAPARRGGIGLSRRWSSAAPAGSIRRYALSCACRTTQCKSPRATRHHVGTR
jgi:hypothetical protein